MGYVKTGIIVVCRAEKTRWCAHRFRAVAIEKGGTAQRVVGTRREHHEQRCQREQAADQALPNVLESIHHQWWRMVIWIRSFLKMPGGVVDCTRPAGGSQHLAMDRSSQRGATQVGSLPFRWYTIDAAFERQPPKAQ